MKVKPLSNVSKKLLITFLILLFSFGSIFAQNQTDNSIIFVNESTAFETVKKLTLWIVVCQNQEKKGKRVSCLSNNFAESDIKEISFLIDLIGEYKPIKDISFFERSGYLFETNISDKDFVISATPREYRNSGIKSFFISSADGAIVHGVDKNGRAASASDASLTVPLIPKIILSIKNVPVNAEAAANAANAAAAISSLQTLHAAQVTFQVAYGNGKYAETLKQLGDAGLIDLELAAAGIKSGYKFTLKTKNSSVPEFEIFAKPVLPDKSGNRSYYVNDSGMVMEELH